jgi:hypothetical protein
VGVSWLLRIISLPAATWSAADVLSVYRALARRVGVEKNDAMAAA